MDPAEEQRLLRALASLHARIQAFSDEEARSALVKGWAAQGGLLPLKMKLIQETDDILDKLMGKSDA